MWSEDHKHTEPRRRWRKEDRTKTSIFQIFRDSHHENDARKQRARDKDGSVEVTKARRQRREGVSAEQLRAHIQADLVALISTVRLESVVDLEDSPHVATSIINYGFRDFSDVGQSDFHSAGIIESIRKTLIAHEPRLVNETLEVDIHEDDDRDTLRLLVFVKAELMGDPVDIPLDFDAEVDMGAGKLNLSRLRVRT